jgi:GAF domain-containing protein
VNNDSSRLRPNRALLAASDVDRLSGEAVRLVQRELAARTVTLFLYSKKGLLVPVASAGLVPAEADTEAYGPGEDLVGFCAAGRGDTRYGERVVARRPLLETSPEFQRIFGAIIEPDTEVAYIPLHGPNRTYGVLRCIAGHSSEGEEIRFSREDLQGLDVYAHQVAISISSLRRKIELDVLTDANKLLADQPQNVLGVYDLITSALVAKSTEYAACSIRMRDRRGDLVLASLSVAPGIVPLDKDRAGRRPDAGLAAEALSARVPLIISDVQSRIDEFYGSQWLLENEIVTAAILPIYLDDENIGALALYLWYPYAFNHSKLEFLKNLCHQVAVATRVVDLLTAREQLIKRMSTIVSLTGTANELLQTILDAACDLTGARQGYIALISRRDANLKPKVTTRHLSPDDIPPIQVNGKGLTALAVRSKASVRVGGVRLDPNYVDFNGDAQGKTRSELVVPLLHEHVLGVIALQSDQVDDFTQTDQLLLETLAQYATLVFHRDLLYEGTKTLAEIDFSRASRERVMSVIARSAVQLVDADAAILRTYSSVTGELVLEAYYPETMNVGDVPTAMQRDTGACWDALTMRDVLKFDDLPNNHRFQNQDFVKSNGFRDMVSVPLLLPGEDTEHAAELGVINVFFRTPGPFFDVERQLLRLLGVSASYAIHDLSIIERSIRAQAMAAITARTTAAAELSSRLANEALRPLSEARLATEAIGRANRGQDPSEISKQLVELDLHIGSLESLISQLAPNNRMITRADQIEVLSDAFRRMHANLFTTKRQPHLSIGPTELWDDVTTALRRVIELVRLPLAAAYISSHRDYGALWRVSATRGNDSPGLDTIALAASDEFSWLADRAHVLLPRDQAPFTWFDPQAVIGTARAVLYGHEVTGGRLMVVVLGFEENRTLSFEDLAVLYESVAVQIFAYVDSAMFGIELDLMTSETGHLMGRAIGKVESGTRVLRALLESPATGDPVLTELAKSAVDDGLTRLKLIHNNFYWFRAQRRFLESGLGAPGEVSYMDEIDVSAMLRDMLAMFRREARDRGLKPTRFVSRERIAIVRGQEDLLRLVFLNLYDNAVKFAYTNTFIDARLACQGGVCIVAFENLGVGVAPDEVRAVFERLRRSRFHDPHKRVEGLGLGLAYCRRVVEDIFKGSIELTSRVAETRHKPRFEGDNWLTTVTVALPLIETRRLA